METSSSTSVSPRMHHHENVFFLGKRGACTNFIGVFSYCMTTASSSSQSGGTLYGSVTSLPFLRFSLPPSAPSPFSSGGGLFGSSGSRMRSSMRIRRRGMPWRSWRTSLYTSAFGRCNFCRSRCNVFCRSMSSGKHSIPMFCKVLNVLSLKWGKHASEDLHGCVDWCKHCSKMIRFNVLRNCASSAEMSTMAWISGMDRSSTLFRSVL
mmetsp:Transcript_75972/g.232535  ORF Transcript_75972/g.232535 Transcript_75972/m.232535 type:complete len:208 (-) Transcript_75972:1317-1940(-)